MYVAELKLMSIQPKIDLFNQTASRDDYYKVKKVFHDVEKDLDEIIHNEETNEKKINKIDEEIKDLKEEISQI